MGHRSQGRAAASAAPAMSRPCGSCRLIALGGIKGEGCRRGRAVDSGRVGHTHHHGAGAGSIVGVGGLEGNKVEAAGLGAAAAFGTQQQGLEVGIWAGVAVALGVGGLGAAQAQERGGAGTLRGHSHAGTS